MSFVVAKWGYLQSFIISFLTWSPREDLHNVIDYLNYVVNNTDI